MEFKDLLNIKGKGNDTEVIEHLRNAKEPVILYGAGDIAGRIIGKLRQNGIHIARIAGDEAAGVRIINDPSLSEIEQSTMAEVERDYPACHLVAGYVRGYNNPDIARRYANVQSVSWLSEIFDMEPVEPSFIRQNREPLEALYHRLADPLSKESFVAYLLSKITQDMKPLPPVFDRNPYFPDGLLTLTRDESFFDCGAYTGDTIDQFIRVAGGYYRYIWAIEPDRENYRKLTDYIRSRNLPHIETVNKGVYSHPGRQPFQEDASMLSMISEDSPHYIDVDTIDRMASGRPVTYIKMDVEGAELMALKGAEQTIRQNRPVLGISIYHRRRDLIDIPAFISELVPEYRFHFRVHKKLAIDTVLYAVAR
jgi:FkbM family methyltransferase